MRELTIVKPTRRPPGPTARARAKRRRAEDKVAKTVRAACAEADDYCRFRLSVGYLTVVGECAGYSEWMHLEDKKRARTRGMAPSERHTSAGSMQGCTKHHRLYDAGDILLAMGELGANGPIRVETAAGVYVIPARRTA